MLLLSWGHLAAIYSSAQASINNNNNNNNACNPCDPVAAYSALSHLHDHKQWEFGSLLPGESQPSSHKHCSLQAALLKAPWISSARENLSSWAGFWDPSHMSEDTPLSTDPLGSSLTAPLLNSLFPADGYNFTPCSQSPLKGHGFQCRFRVQCHQAFCMPLPTTELCNLWCMYQMTLATRRVPSAVQRFCWSFVPHGPPKPAHLGSQPLCYLPSPCQGFEWLPCPPNPVAIVHCRSAHLNCSEGMGLSPTPCYCRQTDDLPETGSFNSLKVIFCDRSYSY